MDITAGGGSIPFETGRLGLRSHANDLNPVAAFILRASCRWPQQFGIDLLDAFDAVGKRFKKRVTALLDGVYPEEPPSERSDIGKNLATTRAHRYAQTYLWARVVACPSCQGQIPLSPNWRLTPDGMGIRLRPNVVKGKCEFEIVHAVADQSPGTVKNAIATCPYPNCGTTTPKGYIAQEAQAGRLSHQLYCVVYRDQWQEYTKAGRPKKRLTTRRGFRVATPDDDNSIWIAEQLLQLQSQWEADDILPSEAVPEGNKTREPHRYGMPTFREMFSPRQQLAHGYCVQAFRELVDQDQAVGELDPVQEAAYGYLALGLDKMIKSNSLLSRWVPKNAKVVGAFDRHDFGMKWSYAEMAVTLRGLGLDWALDDLQKCISDLVEMSGYKPKSETGLDLAHASKSASVATPAKVTCSSADTLFFLGDQSVDAVVFDPPYYDNVNYAELSDFFYVWLKRTAGYVFPDWFSHYLTDKANEAIASPVRFPTESGKRKSGSVKDRAYEDYVDRMRRIFAECRRVVKDDGIVTLMFTHKSTEAWDALTMGIIEAGFRITATWPVKTEADASLNIRDRAAARSTILLACRPQTEPSAGNASWEQVEQEVAAAVQKSLPRFEQYDLKPLDVYLASFGPALEVISKHWPIRRELANPERPHAPFLVTPNDALQVARREVLGARRRKISSLWADNPGDSLTEFYILSRDGIGSATLPFDEATLIARCIGLELSDGPARGIYEKKGSNINLLTGQRRLARGHISPDAPTPRSIDRVHIAVALAGHQNVNTAIAWCKLHRFPHDAAFKGTLEALLRIMPASDPDLSPARTLWSEMYSERLPEPAGIQASLFPDPLPRGDERSTDAA